MQIYFKFPHKDPQISYHQYLEDYYLTAQIFYFQT